MAHDIPVDSSMFLESDLRNPMQNSKPNSSQSGGTLIKITYSDWSTNFESYSLATQFSAVIFKSTNCWQMSKGFMSFMFNSALFWFKQNILYLFLCLYFGVYFIYGYNKI